MLLMKARGLSYLYKLYYSQYLRLSVKPVVFQSYFSTVMLYESS